MRRNSVELKSIIAHFDRRWADEEGELSVRVYVGRSSGFYFGVCFCYFPFWKYVILFGIFFFFPRFLFPFVITGVHRRAGRYRRKNFAKQAQHSYIYSPKLGCQKCLREYCKFAALLFSFFFLPCPTQGAEVRSKRVNGKEYGIPFYNRTKISFYTDWMVGRRE